MKCDVCGGLHDDSEECYSPDEIGSRELPSTPVSSARELIVGTMYVDPDPDEDFSGMTITERWSDMLREKGITGNIQVVLRLKR